MSLHELSGPSLHLVLSIKEGHGFGFLQHPIVIVAGTCNIQLETEIVPPSPDPIFHVDFAWETDKKSLRRFRTSNTPIKVECFTVDVNEKRDCIGSTLLNIKSAQAIPNGSESKIVERWHKLIGVPAEAKALQPELLLSLTIQESSAVTQHPSAWSFSNANRGPLPHPQSSSASNTARLQHMLPTQLRPTSPVVPLLHESEGHIQLGPVKSCTNLFLLSIHVGNVINVGMLLPLGTSDASEGSQGEPFQISCSIFNQSVSTKPFGKANWEKSCLANETIVIPLRTSLSVFHTYLQENPSVSVRLLFFNREVAATELHWRSLVPTDTIVSFSQDFRGESVCSQLCSWVSTHTGGVPTCEETQPYVEITTKLQLTTPAPAAHLAPRTVPPLDLNKPAHHDAVQVKLSGGKDQSSSQSDSGQSQDTFVMTTPRGPKWVPVAPPQPQQNKNVFHSEIGVPCTVQSCESTSVKKFVLTIKPTFIVLEKLPVSSRIWISFECPNLAVLTSGKTDAVVVRVKEPVALVDMVARIEFQSSNEQLARTLSEKVEVFVNISEVVTDSNAMLIFSSTKLNIDVINFLDKKECCSSSILKGVLGNDQVGMLYTTISLEKCDRGQWTSAVDEAVQSSLTQASVDEHQVQSSNFQSHQERNFSVLEVPGGHESHACNTQSSAVCHIPSQKLFRPELHHSAAQPIFKPPPHTMLATQPMQTPAAPTIAPLDSSVAYHIVEELEDWKERQQEIFQAELKEKEACHLSKLEEAWSTQKRELEALVQSLTNANKDLRDRLKSTALHEKELAKAKAELLHQYNMKFQELTLAAKRLDEEAKLKVSLAEMKCSQLEGKVNVLVSENESLRQQLSRLTNNASGDSQMCGMSHNQVTRLLSQVKQLEDKLQTSLQSKALFKEQWGRAVREMNQARSQAAETARKYSVEELLGKEEAELQSDRKALEELKRQLTDYSAQ